MKIIFDLVRFGLGGTPGLIVNCVILFVSSFLGVKGMGIIVVSIIAFVVREILTFTIHRWWTFKTEAVEKELREEIVSFVVLTSSITAANTVWFYVFAKLYVDPTLSQVVLSFIFFFVNFPAMRKVFIKVKKSPSI